ncbi:MAG: ribose-phosphate diphosphokinase [Methanobacterium sp.]
MIIGGSASQKLAAKVAWSLGENLTPIETRRFPDGERYIRIKGDVLRDVVVIQSTGYPQDENLMELFLLLKNLKSLGVERTRVVIPYFGYGRQERRFKSGEAVSAVIVAELLEAAGASEIYSINLHEKNIKEFFNIPVHEISAMPLIANYIEQQIDNPMIIGPDKGALGFAQEVSGILKCECDYLDKVRISPEKVEMKPKNLDVEGRDVVIIDDIISTGGTIVSASKILRDLGANKVVVGCVHPVLVEDALLKIFAAGVDDVFATDTLKSDVSNISVAPLLSGYLKKYE